jgi:hypothetical protein
MRKSLVLNLISMPPLFGLNWHYHAACGLVSMLTGNHTTSESQEVTKWKLHIEDLLEI